MSIYFNQTNITAGTPFSSGGGSNTSNFHSGLTTGTAGQGGFVAGISSFNAELDTTATGYSWIPQYFKFRPDQAVKGGLVANVIEWDAVDTGANLALVYGANTDTAFITSQWPGYISMPLDFSGANLTLRSDNETFMFCEGNAGGLGNISTGTPFISAYNNFSSIQDPTKAYTADMTALLSTFKDLYPGCFS